MNVLNVVSFSEDQTYNLAKKLAPSFIPGNIIVLRGSLGSGKTVFVRGLAAGRGIDENKVNSPSYTFVNEYPAEVPLYHFDLYRLHEESDLYEIGWDEYINRNGIIVIEWGEKAGDYLPEKYYDIEFIILSENEREINITLVTSDD